MKRKVLSILVVLALILGTATVAIAAKTDGSIEFKGGGIIIIPPRDCNCCPKCCDCDCDEVVNGDCECGCPCPCTCEDPYDSFFWDNDVERNLNFGTHDMLINGRFDSANKPGSPQAGQDRYTGEAGKYTGVEVLNKTGQSARVDVSISKFMIDGNPAKPTLDGATLTMMLEKSITDGVFPEGAYDAKTNVRLETGDALGNSATMLDIGRGVSVKVAWYGILFTAPQTNDPGEAQAILTWDAMNV